MLELLQDDDVPSPGYSITIENQSSMPSSPASLPCSIKSSQSSSQISVGCPLPPDTFVDALLGTKAPYPRDPVHSPAVSAYQCVLCYKHFSRLWVLNKHYEVAHANTRLVPCKCGRRERHTCFTCERCDKVFPSKAQLIDHTQSSHPSVNQWTCKLCKDTFPSQQLHSRHFVECKSGKLNRATPGTPELPTKTTNCGTCGERFRSRAMIVAHTFNQTLLSHTCDICKKVFCKLTELFVHVSHSHPGRRVYTCGLCGEEQKNHRNLSYHIIDIHECNPNNNDVGCERMERVRYCKKGKLRYRQKMELKRKQWKHSWDLKWGSDRIKTGSTARRSRMSVRINEAKCEDLPTMLHNKENVDIPLFVADRKSVV